MELDKIINKKVIAILGFSTDKRKKHHEPAYILFDDGETFIELEEQDYFAYHDCSPSARNITIHTNSHMWEYMKNDKTGHPKANIDI